MLYNSLLSRDFYEKPVPTFSHHALAILYSIMESLHALPRQPAGCEITLQLAPVRLDVGRLREVHHLCLSKLEQAMHSHFDADARHFGTGERRVRADISMFVDPDRT